MRAPVLGALFCGLFVGFSQAVSSTETMDSLALRSPQTQSLEQGRLDLISSREKQPFWKEADNQDSFATHLLPYEVPIPAKENGMRDVRLQGSSTSPRRSFNQRVPTPSKESWRGYLSEKGPNRVVVVEVNLQQPETLPDSIWALIQGPSRETVKTPGSREGSTPVERESRTLVEGKDSSTEPSVPSTIDSQEPAKTPANRGSTRELDMSVDEVMDTHQRLMELFSTPVFAGPNTTSSDADSVLSLRLPASENRSSVREGSRARFEIRR
jgi:hypothetical protein